MGPTEARYRNVRDCLVKLATFQGRSIHARTVGHFQNAGWNLRVEGNGGKFWGREVKVQQLATIAPGEYMIFSQTTQNKTLIFDGPTKRRPQW